ncbi:unnamed protein product [Linum tenue]|uniref:Uncharacterized protein n=1 Tax=Linum tenue TaxID=586396 RepID=A0AAV0PPE3_9ROSI|nr:unnamed protein product [Linum tenue]
MFHLFLGARQSLEQSLGRLHSSRESSAILGFGYFVHLDCRCESRGHRRRSSVKLLKTPSRPIY